MQHITVYSCQINILGGHRGFACVLLKLWQAICYWHLCRTASGLAGHAVDVRLTPTQPYITWRGHAGLTILRLPNNQLCSGCTVGQANIISTAQVLQFLPSLCTTCLVAHICTQDTRHTLLRSKKGYALGQQLRVGLSIGMPMKNCSVLVSADFPNFYKLPPFATNDTTKYVT